MKILMVDDDGGMEEVDGQLQDIGAIGSYLEAMVRGGHSVEHVQNVPDAWKALDRTDFELIIVDLQITPVEGERYKDADQQTVGLNFYWALRKRWPSKRIIILSNNTHYLKPKVFYGESNTRTFDKAQMDGSELVEFIRRWR